MTLLTCQKYRSNIVVVITTKGIKMQNKPLDKDAMLDTMSIEEIHKVYADAMSTVISAAGAIVQSKDGGESPNMFAVAGFILMNLPEQVAPCYKKA